MNQYLFLSCYEVAGGCSSSLPACQIQRMIAGELATEIPMLRNLRSKQQQMKTQLRASPSIENTKDTIIMDRNTMMMVVQITSESVPFCPYLTTTRPSADGMPTQSTIPNKLTRSEMKSTTQKTAKFQKMREMADLAQLMQDYPVTAITITVLWFRTWSNPSMHERQHASIQNMQLRTPLSSPSAWSWTNLLSRLTIATSIAAKVREPRWNLLTRQAPVVKQLIFRPQYQLAQALEIRNVWTQQKKYVMKMKIKTYTVMNASYFVVLLFSFRAYCLAKDPEINAANQKTKKMIAKNKGYKGAIQTVGFSVMKLAATSKSLIPILILSLQHQTMQPKANIATRQIIKRYQILVTTDKIARAISTMKVRAIIDHTMHLVKFLISSKKITESRNAKMNMPTITPANLEKVSPIAEIPDAQ